MAKDDYSSTGGGLKLKGAKPTGVEKKRKKKIKNETDVRDIESRKYILPKTRRYYHISHLGRSRGYWQGHLAESRYRAD